MGTAGGGTVPGTGSVTTTPPLGGLNVSVTPIEPSAAPAPSSGVVLNGGPTGFGASGGGAVGKDVGGIALRGQSGRTTRTTLPLVDGSEDVARLRLARQRL
jgi:hypothetical protein